MFVLIWLVQLYVYPGFRNADANTFLDWHKRYTRRVSWFVGPLMFGQLISGTLLLLADASLASAVYLILVIATWILTGLVAAPLHGKLQKCGKDLGLISRLIAWNWPRTVLWTAIVFV